MGQCLEREENWLPCTDWFTYVLIHVTKHKGQNIECNFTFSRRGLVPECCMAHIQNQGSSWQPSYRPCGHQVAPSMMFATVSVPSIMMAALPVLLSTLILYDLFGIVAPEPSQYRQATAPCNQSRHRHCTASLQNLLRVYSRGSARTSGQPRHGDP